MKIDILTFHFVSNQGGVLQCYALQTFLEKQGHEVRVIDYRPSYHTVRYDAVKNPFVYTRWYWRRFRNADALTRAVRAGKSFARCIYLNARQDERITAQLFSNFIQKNLHLTEKYTTLKQLRKRPPQADAYVVGSDQLWNPDLLDFEFDPAYFLDFGGSAIPRISYAVSTGRQLNKNELSQLGNLCERLSAVSIRENNEQLIKAVGRDVHICIDPTLLLHAEDYASVENTQNEAEPYIFVYGFEDTDEIHQAVEKAVEKYHCRVLNGCPHRIKLQRETVKLRALAPDRFLTLVKNARCVVTNSFHGTAFSVIYRKDFITVSHRTRGGRMTELLTKLGLRSRLWGDSMFSFEGTPDYEEANKRIELLRRHSAEFLLASVSGKRGEEISHIASERMISEVREEEAPLHVYAGYFLNTEKLKASASGGAATALAEVIIARGGIVFGIEYTEGFQTARYGFAETVEDLDRFHGSKYIYPEIHVQDGRSVFDLVEEKLRENRFVLFVGLGCIVSGLLHRLERRQVDTSQLYTVDLICHGTTLPAVQKEYIRDLEQCFGSKVISFDTRNKKHGWASPYVRAVFANGKEYTKPLYETDLGFALKYYSRNSCYCCSFKGASHPSDVTVGDCWGLKPGMAEYNKNGTSVLFYRTEKGEELIRTLDERSFHLASIDAAFAVKHNPMFSESARKPSFYNILKKDLEERGLHYAVKHSVGYKIYVKAAVKNRLLRLLHKK